MVMLGADRLDAPTNATSGTAISDAYRAACRLLRDHAP